MALLRCSFFSDVLEVGTDMTVLLPQAGEHQIGVSAAAGAGGPSPVLYLLHGLSDDATAWQRFTGIERYAAELGLAVVMPQVGRSFYADEVHGARYWTFLSEELPRVVESFFAVSTAREDTFVAGLSMGGYGALTWALRRPERFAAAASLSGALDLTALYDERSPLFDRVFGGRPGPGDDVLSMLESADHDALPAFYVGCGNEDELHPASVRFADAATAAGCDVQVDFRPGGHEWEVWDATIRDVLAWLPLAR